MNLHQLQWGLLMRDSMRSMMRIDNFSYLLSNISSPREVNPGAVKSTVTFLSYMGPSSKNVGKDFVIY